MLACRVGVSGQDISTRYPVIPQPEKIEALGGSFEISDKVRIGVADPSLLPVAGVLSMAIREASGISLKTEAGKQSGCIFFSFDRQIQNSEGYQLTIKPGEITISAATSTGAF